MNEHANGRENATQLEQRLSNHGVLFHTVQGHGFIVVGEDQIFIVEEDSPTDVEGFSFNKIPFSKVQQFRVEAGEPTDRYDNMDDDKVEKVSDGGSDKTSTHIRLWLRADAQDVYVDADPRAVASAFVTFTLEKEPNKTGSADADEAAQ